ncbi:hypothetical protein ACHAQA_000475 [Verticillium albo-atrum]
MSMLAPLKASNGRLTQANTPRTAVFLGATDGIGKATLKALVSTGFPLRAYVVGRNEAQHQALITELRAINNNAEIIYIEGQISLMSEVKRIADDISSKEQEIDLLFHSAGRFLFISRLLPKLRAAAKLGSGGYSPRVVSILAAGSESTEVFLDDLSLKEPDRFSIPNYAKHAATMVTLSMKRFAEKSENEGVVFIHAHPGLVATDLMRKSWGDQWSEQVAGGGGPPPGTFSRSTPEEAGQKALYLLTSAEYGGNGVSVPDGRAAGSTVGHKSRGSLFSVNDVMEGLHQDDLFAKLEAQGAPDAVWDYTVKTVDPWL